MNNIEELIFAIDSVLDTRRKRHIIGGALLSLSLMFGGLAITVVTIKNE